MYEQGRSTLNGYDAWNLKEVKHIKDKKKFIRCITYKVSFKVSVRSEGPYTLHEKRLKIP